MSYTTVKSYLDGRLSGLGYSEAPTPFNFEDVPSTGYNNMYILSAETAERSEENDTLLSRYRDIQTWQVKIAFRKSSNEDVIVRDDIHDKREDIIKDLDDSTNWTSSVYQLRYEGWEMEELDSYILLTIELSITDDIAY